MQRLAERSGEATKQIGAMVKTILTDTQDAVSRWKSRPRAWSRGRLSDAAGQALGEIGKVSRQLAELIEGISRTTSAQAESAGVVAKNIQEILHISEATSKGTRQTADSVRQLASLAQELKHRSPASRWLDRRLKKGGSPPIGTPDAEAHATRLQRVDPALECRFEGVSTAG